MVATQAARDVRENDMSVVQLDRERGAREDLLDAPVDLQRSLLRILDDRLGGAGIGVFAIASGASDNVLSF